MYNDIYNMYKDDSFIYHDDLIHQKTYIDKDRPTYQVDYGNTINLPFKIPAQFRNDEITLIIYNFRYESIFNQECLIDEDGFIHLEIDHEKSKELLEKGIYYIGLYSKRYIVQNDDTSNLEFYTIIPPNKCSLHIR